MILKKKLGTQTFTYKVGRVKEETEGLNLRNRVVEHKRYFYQQLFLKALETLFIRHDDATLLA